MACYFLSLFTLFIGRYKHVVDYLHAHTHYLPTCARCLISTIKFYFGLSVKATGRRLLKEGGDSLEKKTDNRRRHAGRGELGLGENKKARKRKNKFECPPVFYSLIPDAINRFVM